MRVAPLLGVIALLATAGAEAKSDKKSEKKAEAKAEKKEPPPPEPRKPGPEDDKMRALLDKLVTSGASGRNATVEAIEKLAPSAVDALAEWLVRPHAVDIEDRKRVLLAIKAAVPDKSGNLAQPQKEQYKADDAVDWLAQLTTLEALPTPPPEGLGEVIADDIAIRALASTKDAHAAQLMFDAAYAPETLIYRDEVGRYLRKMSPASIAALTRASQTGARKWYATLLLERLDRQDALKALSSAMGNEDYQVAILAAFRDTHHREAVHAVWTMVDNPIPRVRAIAREAWMGYVDGPPPPPAPRERLKLPGGKFTKYAKPLWLTYRELADNELRKAAKELFNEDYPLADPSLDDTDHGQKTVEIDLVAMTKRIFEFYDQRRVKADGDAWLAAKKLADGGDLAGATAAIDRLIAENPDRPERAQMAQVFASYAKQLETAQKWGDASVAFSKAAGLDPKSPTAKELLAGHHYTLGMALKEQGKDGQSELDRAAALKPDYAAAKAPAPAAAAAGDKPVWMLYAAAGAAGLAMLLFAAAMMRRRARA